MVLDDYIIFPETGESPLILYSKDLIVPFDDDAQGSTPYHSPLNGTQGVHAPAKEYSVTRSLYSPVSRGEKLRVI
jgi:hypothetical protein